MAAADPILTVAQMRAAEQALIDGGETVSSLMERAGAGAADWVWRVAGGRPVTEPSIVEELVNLAQRESTAQKDPARQADLHALLGLLYLDVLDDTVRAQKHLAAEGPLHPVIPAISNAIHDAVGIRMTELPFHPAALLKKLREQKQHPGAPAVEQPRTASVLRSA